jgi:hypothetical protein
MRGACGEWADQKSPSSTQVVARGAARCASQVLRRSAHAVPAAPLVVRRRYLIEMPSILPCCASKILDRGAQIDVHGTAHELERGTQAVARGGARFASQVLDRDAQAGARGATQVLDSGAQVVARGASRCASQVLDRSTQAVARGAARCLSKVLDLGTYTVSRGAAPCASQVLGRGARAVARGAAAQSQQEKNNSVDVQRSRVNYTGFICAAVR